MDILISIFAIFSLAFLIKEIEGPWGIVSTARNWVMNNSVVGVFFFKLLECYYCLGFWCGIAIYLLSQNEWHAKLLICWGLAGAAISLIFSQILYRLSVEE